MGPRTPQLPAEIWLLILEYLPASFFQQDIRRLTVSRVWYALAYKQFIRQLEFTPPVISRIMHRKSKAMDKTRAMLRENLRSVRIVLEGIAPLGDHENACFDTATNVRELAYELMNFKELRHLTFVAKWPNRTWRADPLQTHYLPLRSIEPYIGPIEDYCLLMLQPSLTSLDIDLCGTGVKGYVHICTYFGILLERLKTLKVRLRHVCSDIVPRDRYGFGDDIPITVGDFTLNLYLGCVSDHNTKLNTATSCRSTHPGLWDWNSEAAEELRTAMKGLLKRMPQPKRARIIHLAPTGEVHVWDAGTDSCVVDKSEPRRCFPKGAVMGGGKSCHSGPQIEERDN
ncbi:hypothetical protein B0H66DRAFT_535693 [Apodospora peruviana]|uniref:F-box domain-containing protein n=1 Tax=Apodospora peruviana TaxID=516989 RepID=A0AAE0HXS3_9PEZI|nr:hypothetical protein B0H66DRAFT_535693 [Apodospora peruviana]